MRFLPMATSSPMPFSAIDHLHMAQALRLAERGLYTTQPNPRVGCVIAQGGEPVPGHDGRLDLSAVLARLVAHACNEVQVEAGARLSGAWLEAGLVDEILLYVAPTLLGDAARPLFVLPPLTDMSARRPLRWLDRRMIGEDVRLRLRPGAAADEAGPSDPA